MILMLRMKQGTRFGALRVLDFALMGGDYSHQAAVTFVDKLGLKVSLPGALMLCLLTETGSFVCFSRCDFHLKLGFPARASSQHS